MKNEALLVLGALLLLHASYSLWEGRAKLKIVRMEARGAQYTIPLDIVVEAVSGYLVAVLGSILKYSSFQDVLDLRKDNFSQFRQLNVARKRNFRNLARSSNVFLAE